MRTPPTGFATIDGARIYYEVAGEGQPLVLLHAGICDSRMWDDRFAAFAERYRVVRYDLRGFGRSRMVAGLYAHRRDLLDLLDHLGIVRAHLVGCSMAGGVALDFAIEHPERVSALVLVGAAVGGHQLSGDPPPRWAALAAAEQAGDLERVAELEVAIWVDGAGQRLARVPAALREKVREMNPQALRTPPGLGQEERLDPPAAGRLGEVRTPPLAIIGDLDQPGFIVRSDLLANGIPGARRAVMVGTAHLPSMERPTEFNRLVLDFLAGTHGIGT